MKSKLEQNFNEIINYFFCWLLLLLLLFSLTSVVKYTKSQRKIKWNWLFYVDGRQRQHTKMWFRFLFILLCLCIHFHWCLMMGKCACVDNISTVILFRVRILFYLHLCIATVAATGCFFVLFKKKFYFFFICLFDFPVNSCR